MRGLITDKQEIIKIKQQQAEERERVAIERKRIEHKRLMREAEPYILADRTDPFTRRRVYTHITNGVGTLRRDALPLDRKYAMVENKNDPTRKSVMPVVEGDRPGSYSGVEYIETRDVFLGATLSDGTPRPTKVEYKAYKSLTRP